MEPIGARISGMEHKVDEIKRAVESVANMRDNTSNSTITVTGATGWQVTCCLLLAVLGMASGAFGLYIALDTRNAQRADALELRQDIKAIRAYINAGMVRPKEK